MTEFSSEMERLAYTKAGKDGVPDLGEQIDERLRDRQPVRVRCVICKQPRPLRLAHWVDGDYRCIDEDVCAEQAIAAKLPCGDRI